MNTHALIFCGGAIVFGVVILLYLVVNSLKGHYRLTHNYPYELMPQGRYRYPGLTIIVFFVSCLILAFVFGLSFYRLTSSVVAGAILGLATLLILPLIYIDDDNRRIHTIISYVFFGICIAGSFLTGIGGLIEVPIIGSPTFPTGAAITFLIIGSLQLILLCNPKIWHPTFLEKCEEDGKVIYVRPQRFALALYEWIFVFSLLAEMAVILIISFFAASPSL